MSRALVSPLSSYSGFGCRQPLAPPLFDLLTTHRHAAVGQAAAGSPALRLPTTDARSGVRRALLPADAATQAGSGAELCSCGPAIAGGVAASTTEAEASSQADESAQVKIRQMRFRPARVVGKKVRQ